MVARIVKFGVLCSDDSTPRWLSGDSWDWLVLVGAIVVLCIDIERINVGGGGSEHVCRIANDHVLKFGYGKIEAVKFGYCLLVTHFRLDGSASCWSVLVVFILCLCLRLAKSTFVHIKEIVNLISPVYGPC